MPDLDYALLCDFVRVQEGVAHIVAAGIDTVQAPQVPTGRNLGLVMRLTFTRNECGRPHRTEIIFQDTDGKELLKLAGEAKAEWVDGLPLGWKTGALLGLNFGLPLPSYGVYSLEILVNDQSVKSLNLRVVPRAAESL